MATNNSSDVTDTADEKRHIFPFFDLPQELRDEIYDLSLIDYTAQLKCGLDLKATGVPSTDLLLVSKAFGKEYQLRAKKKSLWTLIDTPSWPHDDFKAIPVPARSVHAVQANVLIEQVRDLGRHQAWLSSFMERATHVSSLSIRVNFQRTLSERNVPLSTFAGWTDWKGLAELKVYRVRWGNSGFDFTPDEGLHLQWSKTTGKIEKVSARDQVADEGA